MIRTANLVAMALTCMLASACSGKGDRRHPNALIQPRGPSAQNADEAGEEGTRYELSIAAPHLSKVGEEDVVTIKVLPRGNWHLNMEYPASLKIDAPKDVTLAMAVQKKTDAIRYDENGCEFSVPFTAGESGEKWFSGQLKFAVCQDETCAPIAEPIRFAVGVN